MSEAKNDEAIYRNMVRTQWGGGAEVNTALLERRSRYRTPETPPILRPLSAADGAGIAIGCLLVAICLVQLAIWIFV